MEKRGRKCSAVVVLYQPCSAELSSSVSYLQHVCASSIATHPLINSMTCWNAKGVDRSLFPVASLIFVWIYRRTLHDISTKLGTLPVEIRGVHVVNISLDRCDPTYLLSPVTSHRMAYLISLNIP
jgi:hypothetical protein